MFRGCIWNLGSHWEIANFVAYAFARAILVTPLRALSVIISAALAHIILRERLNIFSILGCVLCVVGSTTNVRHTPQEREIEFASEVWDLATELEDLPDDWKDASDVHSLRTLDRSFVFPGEQVCILACLSAYKQDTEIITPFKVAAVMNKNGKWQSPKKQNGFMGDGTDSPNGPTSPNQSTDQNGESLSTEKIAPSDDVITHLEQERVLSICENAKLQGFPDYYMLHDL